MIRDGVTRLINRGVMAAWMSIRIKKRDRIDVRSMRRIHGILCAENGWSEKIREDFLLGCRRRSSIILDNCGLVVAGLSRGWGTLLCGIMDEYGVNWSALQYVLSRAEWEDPLPAMLDQIEEQLGLTRCNILVYTR